MKNLKNLIIADLERQRNEAPEELKHMYDIEMLRILNDQMLEAAIGINKWFLIGALVFAGFISSCAPAPKSVEQSQPVQAAPTESVEMQDVSKALCDQLNAEPTKQTLINMNSSEMLMIQDGKVYYWKPGQEVSPVNEASVQLGNFCTLRVQGGVVAEVVYPAPPAAPTCGFFSPCHSNPNPSPNPPPYWGQCGSQPCPN